MDSLKILAATLLIIAVALYIRSEWLSYQEWRKVQARMKRLETENPIIRASREIH